MLSGVTIVMAERGNLMRIGLNELNCASKAPIVIPLQGNQTACYVPMI